MPHIMVVGSTMVDMIAYADHLPERGQTVRGNEFRIGYGGKGANQAVMAALLGADVRMVNCLGSDVFADSTIENLVGFSIDVSHVHKVDGVASGVAPIWVEPSGENRIIVVPGANDRLSPSHVDRAFESGEPPDVVVCQLEVPQQTVLRAFERGRAQGATTILNPAPAGRVDPRILALTSWLIPNASELDVFTQSLPDSSTSAGLGEQVARLAESLDLGIVVTLGEHGALVYRPGDLAEPLHVRAPRVETVDTTGAGDAFVGAFAVAVGLGYAVDEAVRFGCQCASSSVTRPGTQTSFARGAEIEGLLAQLTRSRS